MDKNPRVSKPKKKIRIKINKQIFSYIFDAILIGALIYFSAPYIKNAQTKFQSVNLYKITYSTAFTMLNEVNPILPPVSRIDESPEYALENIHFGDTKEKQKNFESNSYEAKSDMEAKETVLRIKSIGLDGRVVDGLNDGALARGFWYLPISAAPGTKGNTVIIGHRFLKIPPETDTFYNLDKVNIGDNIEVEQSNGVISYTVVEKKIIDPNQREVIYPTEDYRLTLITCAPLWENSKRLVVVAIQDEVEQAI